MAEQQKLFDLKSRKGQRIILATNIAEASLTVPGIRYVVDSGLARVSRFSHRNRIQRLPIEKISQASANQRQGRCGRLGPGVCVRLYSEADFVSRKDYTEAEILRTNLAQVILQAKALKFADLESLPFIDKPESKFIRAGLKLLNELNALDDRQQLLPAGRAMAQLPVDVRLARMLITAQELKVLSPVLTIVACLAVGDVWEVNEGQREKAKQSMARFIDKRSDFLTMLNVWQYLNEQKSALSQNQFRKLCARECFSYLRYCEWRNVVSELARTCDVDIKKKASFKNEPVLQAILSGLLSHIGMKGDDNSYAGANAKTFYCFPGSGVYKKLPAWCMAFGLLETKKLYAHNLSMIEPEWRLPSTIKYVTEPVNRT